MARQRQGLLGLINHPTIDSGTLCRNESYSPGCLFGYRMFPESSMMPPILKRGSQGPHVWRLQQLLNSLLKPSPNLCINGNFGEHAEAAVRLYQSSVGLGIDGIVGPRTWSALQTGRVSNPGAAVLTSSSFPNAHWMAVAMKEIGQKEIPGAHNNPRILEYHATTTLKAATDEISWCSSFVNWCLLQVKIAGTNSAAAISWLDWGHEATAGEVASGGAIAIIYNAEAANTSLSVSGNHVGFLVKETAGHYILVGGNQSNQVKISSYPKSSWRLKGYRWRNL
jgi:uncharacterized protein (TIGR02594 family)